MAKVWLRRVSVLYCLRMLLLLVIFPRSRILSNAGLGFFQAQATIWKWPGSVFSDVLGAIPGSPADVEGGFAFA